MHDTVFAQLPLSVFVSCLSWRESTGSRPCAATSSVGLNLASLAVPVTCNDARFSLTASLGKASYLNADEPPAQSSSNMLKCQCSRCTVIKRGRS